MHLKLRRPLQQCALLYCVVVAQKPEIGCWNTKSVMPRDVFPHTILAWPSTLAASDGTANVYAGVEASAAQREGLHFVSVIISCSVCQQV